MKTATKDYYVKESKGKKTLMWDTERPIEEAFKVAKELDCDTVFNKKTNEAISMPLMD